MLKVFVKSEMPGGERVSVSLGPGPNMSQSDCQINRAFIIFNRSGERPVGTLQKGLHPSYHSLHLLCSCSQAGESGPIKATNLLKRKLFFWQLFQGNIDNNSHKKNMFESPFYARYVRVVPWEWHERITLRMELLGCDD